jgi:hypothetical protein
MAFVVYIYGGKRMQTLNRPLVVIVDAQDECFKEPLARFPNLGIETMHANCLNFSQSGLNSGIEEILARRKEDKKYAIFHLSVGGKRENFSTDELAVADAMDKQIELTFQNYGFEVTPIDAVDGQCSLLMANRINEIIAPM